jgi:CYTH domain-containing protein
MRKGFVMVEKWELEREDEGAAIPDYVQIIRDVSADPAYKNRSLAENVVYETI